ncbi:hypothetical protein Pmar_PMAR022016 [Perkinsus marinus ATCC 50983]|uniref:FAD linked oxidase N-terminal domain-containing protein n=1 Tax=Perkinsus marinus (strain ATCC 50983 / TXsc) TaxID=423536 RepID=C5L624_PERM5|nr:hypothetical protein Pmar_PMAR022016 [Perkinsus marinus ATCC 50983]EER07809.1 hypothetical protein Pmar_PMAR022016 [Perkinsus marinus ATCC 50983]|eukprot:XP_002775993.1 hypothetical protein Pmar_PMAR022016 [Perkinsus marinus ATCC 50983]
MFLLRWLFVTFMSSFVLADVNDAVDRLIAALPGQVQTNDIPPPYNTRFDEANGYDPAAMVYVSSAEDIIIVLKICYEEDTPVALRSNGGHSYIGQSTVNGGVIINFSEMKSFDVTYDDDGRYVAKMGSGLMLLEVYSRLARHDPPLGDVYGGPYKAKSIYFPKDMSIETLEYLAEASVDPVCQNAGDCVMLLDFYGHAMSEEPEDCDPSAGKCTSFDHRTPGWHLQMLAIWDRDEPTPTDKLAWIQQTYDSVFPVSLGEAFQNYIDSDLAEGREWISQYFPNADTYPRLQQVKCRYNGIDMFNFAAIDLMTIDIDDDICGVDTTSTTEVPTTTTTEVPTTTTTKVPTTTSTEVPTTTTTEVPTTSTTEVPTTTTTEVPTTSTTEVPTTTTTEVPTTTTTEVPTTSTTEVPTTTTTEVPTTTTTEVPTTSTTEVPTTSTTEGFYYENIFAFE